MKKRISGGIMAQEIEIEFKVLLSEDQYERLATSLPFPKVPVTQINHYFETDDFALRSQKSALRIREKRGKYFLTLKELHEEGILETHDELNKEEFASWLNGQPIPKRHTTERLKLLGIAVNEFKYFGALTTERKTFTGGEIHYFLDKSYYHDTVDYELEIEAPNKEKGLRAFRAILNKYRIERKKPITKIERFFHSLHQKRH